MTDGQRPGPRGGPPPWWPAGEAWPPRRGEWRGVQGRFLRRVGCFLGILFLLMFGAGALLSRLVPGDRPDGPPLGFFGFVLIVLLIVFIGRTVRRTAAPIGDVMAAADRVAGGDYTVRVEPHGSGDVRRLIDSFNEMTARLQADEEVRRNLLADVAHELRTPLSVIRGNVEGMLDGVYPRDDDHLTPIVDETKIMARLLDDLRTLSLAEAGALRLHREPTDVAALVDDVVAAFAPRTAAGGVTLTAAVASTLEAEVDPVRVREVLENVLANALRYTPPGGSIRIEVGSAGPLVTFVVADTGRGIAPEQLPRLFDRFWKSADSGGSGLGLAIAKSLVEAHGGEIDATSALGQGTTVRFTLPLAG